MDLKIGLDDSQRLITEFIVACSRDQLIIKELIRRDHNFRREIEATKARETLEDPYFLQRLVLLCHGIALDDNGMPIESFFKFTTISVVKAYIEKYPKSSYAKLVTCKSLHADSKIFVVAVYGTNGSDQSAGIDMTSNGNTQSKGLLMLE